MIQYIGWKNGTESNFGNYLAAFCITMNCTCCSPFSSLYKATEFNNGSKLHARHRSRSLPCFTMLYFNEEYIQYLNKDWLVLWHHTFTYKCREVSRTCSNRPNLDFLCNSVLGITTKTTWNLRISSPLLGESTDYHFFNVFFIRFF